MTDTTYNGWTNRATWNLALWFDNDEHLYKVKSLLINGYARDNRRLSANDIRETAMFTMGLETPDGDKIIDPDNVTKKLVDFDEIAGHWNDEIAELIAE